MLTLRVHADFRDSCHRVAMQLGAGTNLHRRRALSRCDPGFTCVIEGQPTQVEGYRRGIEAELLLGRYSRTFRDLAA